MAKKRISLKDIEESKISISQGKELINAPKTQDKEDIEILLENLKKVDATIDARDKINYKNTDIDTAIQSVEAILLKSFEKKENLEEVRKVLSQLREQTPGTNLDRIKNLMAKLQELLTYSTLAKPIIEQIWTTLSKYFGLG